VQYVTGTADSVLTVPSAALRVKATPEMIAQAGTTDSAATKPDSAQRAQWRQRMQQSGQAGANGAARAGGSGSGTHSTTGRPSIATIWTLDAQGKAHPVRVMTGMTDGSRTEIKGRNLKEGEQVITSIGDAATASAASSQPASNPFQPSRGGMGGMGRGR
jgi:HlyD family secretion protein